MSTIVRRYYELREVLEKLMRWQVKNVSGWNNSAYDAASRVLKRHDGDFYALPTKMESYAEGLADEASSGVLLPKEVKAMHDQVRETLTTAGAEGLMPVQARQVALLLSFVVQKDARPQSQARQEALVADDVKTVAQRRLVRAIADKIEDGSLFESGLYLRQDLAQLVRDMLAKKLPVRKHLSDERLSELESKIYREGGGPTDFLEAVVAEACQA